MTDIIQPHPELQKNTDNQAPQLSTDEIIDLYAFWRPVCKRVATGAIVDGQPEFTEYYTEINIDYIDFYNFLYSEGFRRFEIAEDIFFIQIINNRILKRVKLYHIQDAVTNFLKLLPEIITFTTLKKDIDIPRRDILTAWIKKQDALLNEKRLQALLKPRETIVFNKDTYNSKFMYFNNGFLCITPEKISFKKYTDLSGYIWQSEIINKDFKQPANENTNNVVKTFFNNIAGKNEIRFKQLMNLTGYLIHNFMAYKRKAILLTDGVIDPDGNANGRSGKSLFCELIGYAISDNIKDPNKKGYISINGKDFDPLNKHKYSAANYETKIVAINDLKPFFNADVLFNDITEGLIVDRKGLEPFRVEPKIIITTNKTLKIEGGSASDRFVEFEFSDHYNKDYTPEIEFKQWFFRDWNQEAWNKFYFFMARCAQTFLNEGKIAKPKSINLDRRKLIDSTNKDFIDFVENEWQPKPGELYEKQTIYNRFIISFPDYKNPALKFTQNKFTIWTKNYMNFSSQWENYKNDYTDIRKNESGQTLRFFKFIANKETDTE